MDLYTSISELDKKIIARTIININFAKDKLAKITKASKGQIMSVMLHVCACMSVCTCVHNMYMLV